MVFFLLLLKWTFYVYLMFIKDAFCEFLDEKYGDGSADKLFQGKASYRLAITYQAGLNVYRGQESMQFVMQNYM